jgi:hypothetical protein
MCQYVAIVLAACRTHLLACYMNGNQKYASWLIKHDLHRTTFGQTYGTVINGVKFTNACQVHLHPLQEFV